jgi:hypothetical protein
MDITKLTTVKVLEELYKNFKSVGITYEFTLQKLVNRTMDLYVKDKEYREKIHEYDNLTTSGSRF